MQRPASGVEMRRVLRAHGVVQGVGFRPFVFRLARSLGLRGRVRNVEGAVEVDVEGDREALARFEERLVAEAPPHARVVSLVARSEPLAGFEDFAIDASQAGPGLAIPPDLGPCARCLDEVVRAEGRRSGYPFTSCTECGPRYTIATALPYDRGRTAMVRFPLCGECADEYADPEDRRFHAETQACPRCGPPLVLEPGAAPSHSEWDIPLTAGDEGPGALRVAREVVARGGILALQGVGGFQLACDATNEAAVAALRRLKRRREKPLAVLVRGIDVASRFVELLPGAVETLSAPERPIVLLPRRRYVPTGDGALARSVAPGLPEVGVMLPASPLHALLAGERPWVLTSGNVSEEPIVVDLAGARRTLAPLARAVLHHERAIVAAADDSVVQLHRGVARVIRRARGHVPRAFPLPFAKDDVLALGGDLKGAICVVKDGAAVLSPHLGDLAVPDVEARLLETWRHLRALLGAEPRAVACDAHPDYVSARIARSLELPVIAVQHHHAHAVACLVEHGRAGPALALALDGAGFGDDGTVWGGEVLLADLVSARRLGRIRPVPSPGGDAAASEPWRSAVAHLVDAGLEGETVSLLPSVDARRVEAVAELVRKRVAAPLASSAGRLFDAVAALAGVRTERGFEGQAAMMLEGAADAGPAAPYEVAVERSASGLIEVDTRPLVRAVARDTRAGRPAAAVSARFHATLAAALVSATRLAREATGVSTVVLCGGCFANRRLLELLEDALAEEGFEVLAPRAVPCGDGGLALGQAGVAAARLRAP